jgi:leucyl/phenylalanyl-tRNA--protein transferase
MEKYKHFFSDPLFSMDDLVAIGGDFHPDRLIYAYTHGIFPWSESPIRWYSPDPRAIFSIHGLHISRTVRKKIRKKMYKIRINQAFDKVMEGCSQRSTEKTWITEGFFKGYTELFERGYCHSFEAYDMENHLVGGVYGVAIGKLFAGESMFSKSSDAGKVALAYLFSALALDQFQIFDTQALNETTWNLGAFEIPKADYLSQLKEAVKIPYKWEPQSLEKIEEHLFTKLNILKDSDK